MSINAALSERRVYRREKGSGSCQAKHRGFGPGWKELSEKSEKEKHISMAQAPFLSSLHLQPTWCFRSHLFSNLRAEILWAKCTHVGIMNTHMCRNDLVITVIWKRVFQQPGTGQTWRSRVWFWQVSGTTQTGRLLLSEIRTEGICFHTVQTRTNWSICKRCINNVSFTFTLLMKRVSDPLFMLVRGRLKKQQLWGGRLWFRGEMTVRSVLYTFLNTDGAEVSFRSPHKRREVFPQAKA